ncbi:MAG TPA: hypothetical protein VGQ19_18115, partial [Burkholderiales bacterium]|nr:hypothetical protein [Burkholderiales bacterium]
IAWVSIVFGFEWAIESLRQVFAMQALRAPAGTALCAYKAKLLELQALKTIADGDAALSALDSRLAALAETQAKLCQAIAKEPADSDRAVGG